MKPRTITVTLTAAQYTCLQTAVWRYDLDLETWQSDGEGRTEGRRALLARSWDPIRRAWNGAAE